MLESMAQKCHLYVNLSKTLFKVISRSLNAAHEQKTSLAQKKLHYTAILLSFFFWSKCRLSKYSSG